MAGSLNARQIEHYRRDGYVSPLRAFSAEQTLAYRRRLEESEARFGPLQVGKLGSKSHLVFTWVDEIARHPAVLDAVESLIGPDILIYTLTMWLKNARDDAYVGWHQDASYFGLEPKEQVTAWVALSESSPESGCVQVIPGSHHHGLMHHSAQQTGRKSMLPRSQSVTNAIDESAAVDQPLKPGEFSLHHTLLIHGSGPNRTSDRRLGIGISYIPARVRFTGSARLTAMRVRGIDHGHFDAEPRPQADCDAAALAFHEATLRNYFESKKELAAAYEPVKGAA